MKVERQGNEISVKLARDELRLLKLALERASFVDTPVEAQEDILAFCEKALETLAAASKTA